MWRRIYRYVGTKSYEYWENWDITSTTMYIESAQEWVEQMGEAQAKRIFQMWEKSSSKKFRVRYSFPDGDGRHDADLASALLYFGTAHSSQTLTKVTRKRVRQVPGKDRSSPIACTIQNLSDITAYVISKIDANSCGPSSTTQIERQNGSKIHSQHDIG
jgi:hypothetical protein